MAGNLNESLPHLEEIWGLQEQAFAGFSSADWQHRHGKDWVFADLPYHLDYFDGEVARAISRGNDAAPEGRSVQRTMAELDAWNAEKFRERPAGQTPEQSVAGLKGTRDAIRQALAGKDDTVLSQPAWFPLVGFGAASVGTLLEGCVAHNWSEYHQLLVRAGRSGPRPSSALTHAALNTYMHFLSAFVKPQRARGKEFTATMAFTGEGGGSWTFHVAGGKCTVDESDSARPDIVMTQAPETFVKTMNKMQNPMVAMLTRKIRVRGFTKMPTFGKLFAEPGKNDPIEPGSIVAAMKS